jgi:cytochrome c biogenesis protein CcdA/thiol-disulfide isomerase/thioredoxin
MVISFVLFTFLLNIFIKQFVAWGEIIQLSMYYALILFGLGFMTHHKVIHIVGAIIGGIILYYHQGLLIVPIAVLVGCILMLVGGRLSQRIQNFGSNVQSNVAKNSDKYNHLTPLLIGLTLGLVWVPCAGPALGFVLTLVRDDPGPRALLLLTTYAVGAAVPLLIIGYGGQYTLRSLRSINKYSGLIKKISGVILIITAISLSFSWFRTLETWLVQNTEWGIKGTEIEQQLFENFERPEVEVEDALRQAQDDTSSTSATSDTFTSDLPIIKPFPGLTGLGAWHNSQPITNEDLAGKVVMIDFWTYSCINCIRTFPHIASYYERFKNDPNFVLIGVHTPEFAFEHKVENVAAAIKGHNLPHPIVQDNDYATWRAFNNRYWPAAYISDKQGNIRYTHFGEGAYEEIPEVIEELLLES